MHEICPHCGGRIVSELLLEPTERRFYCINCGREARSSLVSPVAVAAKQKPKPKTGQWAKPSGAAKRSMSNLLNKEYYNPNAWYRALKDR